MRLKRILFHPGRLFLTVGLAAFAWTAVAQAQLMVVPPGNRLAEQPPVPHGSVSRTRATNSNFQDKYEKIRELIGGSRRLRREIASVSRLYDIAPIHIVGALVGEHTYNVDALDRLQTYLVKAASYLSSTLEFRYEGESILEFTARPEFAPCAGLTDSYDLWGCRDSIWENQFRGRQHAGKKWPDDRFSRVFFQPLFAGQTFGLGQLNPLTALRVNDVVVRVSGFRPLDAGRAPQVYNAIMDPDTTLHYMAAVIRTAIDAYAEIAKMDISGNPGITATLYNLGDVRARATLLHARNMGRSQIVWPQENYYGWLVNDKLHELEPLVAEE